MWENCLFHTYLYTHVHTLFLHFSVNSNNMSLSCLNSLFTKWAIYFISLSFWSYYLECPFQLDCLIKILLNFQIILQMSPPLQKIPQSFYLPVSSFCSCPQTHTIHDSNPPGIIMNGGYGVRDLSTFPTFTFGLFEESSSANFESSGIMLRRQLSLSMSCLTCLCS